MCALSVPAGAGFGGGYSREHNLGIQLFLGCFEPLSTVSDGRFCHRGAFRQSQMRSCPGTVSPTYLPRRSVRNVSRQTASPHQMADCLVMCGRHPQRTISDALFSRNGVYHLPRQSRHRVLRQTALLCRVAASQAILGGSSQRSASQRLDVSEDCIHSGLCVSSIFMTPSWGTDQTYSLLTDWTSSHDYIRFTTHTAGRHGSTACCWPFNFSSLPTWPPATCKSFDQWSRLASTCLQKNCMLSDTPLADTCAKLANLPASALDLHPHCLPLFVIEFTAPPFL